MGMKVVRTLWAPCYRIIASRFPAIEWYEKVSNAEDFEKLLHFEGLFDPHLLSQVGEIDLVPKEDWVFGPGASYIMSAFTFVRGIGTRFCDGTYGVYYAAESLGTSIHETIYHNERGLREGNIGPEDLEMQVILSDLEADLWDVRGPKFKHLHDPDMATYGAGQALSRQGRTDHIDGIRHRSVRRPGGECVAVMRPKVLARARVSQHLIYPWDGHRIDPDRVCVKTLLR
jgi:hypothetical protein